MHALAIDPLSGDILAAGSSGSGVSSQFAVARLDFNGTPDDHFDGDGAWIESALEENEATSIELQSDGKILVAGDTAHPFPSEERDFVVYRLLPDGSPDSSFSPPNGAVGVSFGLDPLVEDNVVATALHAGRLVAAGVAHDPADPGSRAIVARFWSELIFTDGFGRGTSGAWSNAVGEP